MLMVSCHQQLLLEERKGEDGESDPALACNCEQCDAECSSNVLGTMQLDEWTGRTDAYDAQWFWEGPYPQNASLNALWGSAPNDVWAVGDSGAIIHRTGSDWNVSRSNVIVPLRGIWGSAADDVWVVGDGGVILNWDGQSWQQVPVDTSCPSGNCA